MARGCEARLIYGDGYLAYGFGPAHPFRPERLRWTCELIEELGLLPAAERLEPRQATREELLAVHEARYVDAVEQASRREAGAASGEGRPQARAWVPAELLRYGLGTADNPLQPGLHEAAALVFGGSLLAAEQLLEGQASHVFNMGGGLHHAQRDRASGFCIYNDIAGAIRLLRERAGWRVAYVDIDAHHGDGVQAIFYRDPDVLTISFHESGRYLFPGTGFVEEIGEGPGKGSALNVPLEPGTGDDSWLELLQDVVPRALERFGPDVLVSQHGCDGHVLDPLTHLAASTRFYWRSAALLHAWAHEFCGGRWLALGGGGYEPRRVVPRAWAMLWAEMRGTPVAENTPLPAAFLRRYDPGSSEATGWPTRLVDPAEPASGAGAARPAGEPTSRAGEAALTGGEATLGGGEAALRAAARNRETLRRLRQLSPLL